MTDLNAIRRDFNVAADARQAALLARYFKTGKGEYAEGDKFLGLMVPATRALAKKYSGLPLGAVRALLRSAWHEHRLCALFMLAERFAREGEPGRKKIYGLYLANTRYINNWDLVDASAPRITGVWLIDKSRRPLYRLAASRSVWERRIAMLSCFAFIARGESADALAIARKLLNDKHDLIHKAVGWMLREVGSRCSREELLSFLRANYARLPRTTLRYAIEKFLPARRKALLQGRI
jgi:3-methyladenine DNA glycosylase AlkD